MTVIIIIILMMITIIINIILCASSKHAKCCKIWICDPYITRKNSSYWILNVEIYLNAMDIGIPLNKEIKHLSN